MVGYTKHHARAFGVIVGSSSKAIKGNSGKPVKRLFDFEKFSKGYDENPLAYIDLICTSITTRPYTRYCVQPFCFWC
jgi:hypothetical protein